MGCCCVGQMKYGAFRHDLGAPLLDDIKTKLASESKIVIVRLVTLRDIPVGNSYSGSTDAFAELKLLPDDAIAGQQKQLSSVKPQSVSPKWEPPERFQFVVSQLPESKIILSVYHYNSSNEKESIHLGDAQIKLKDFSGGQLTLSGSENQSLDDSVTKTLKVVNPKNGKPAGEAEVTVSLLTLEQACNVQEHVIYEFQRWSPVHNWGNQDSPIHLLPTDPGSWSSEDGKRFGKSMESVSPPIPNGWEVTKSWRTYGTDFDPEGWQYASMFESPFWYSQNTSSSYVVRRRTWHREVRNTGALSKSIDHNSHSRKSSSDHNHNNNNNKGGGGPGRRKRMFSSDKKKK